MLLICVRTSRELPALLKPPLLSRRSLTCRNRGVPVDVKRKGKKIKKVISCHHHTRPRPLFVTLIISSRRATLMPHHPSASTPQWCQRPKYCSTRSKVIFPHSCCHPSARCRANRYTNTRRDDTLGTGTARDQPPLFDVVMTR